MKLSCKAIAIAFGITVFLSPVSSAQERTAFAIKGAGGSSCVDYLTVARDEGNNRLGQYVGWANGYYSRLNQEESTTFDIAPWQSGRLLYLLLAEYCTQNLDRSFGEAVYALGETLAAQRLTTQSPMRTYRVGEAEVALYEEVMRRVQQRLNVLYASNLEVNGDLDDRTVEWIKRLQSEHRLERTGVPNEATLMQLFYPRNANGD